MRDYANDAVLVLDALGWLNADVRGESFGVMVALHLAANSPLRINRLALAAGYPPATMRWMCFRRSCTKPMGPALASERTTLSSKLRLCALV